MLNTLNTQVMKRLFTIGLMLASAFALTNCAEEIEAPVHDDVTVDGNIENITSPEDGVRTPYEIFVDGQDTKTISDGTYTYWVDEESALANGLSKDAIDRVNLYSLEVASNSNVSNALMHSQFTYMGNRTFVGELIGNIGATNNWYCLYPYNEDSSVESATITSQVIIGSSDYIQTQESANNRSHIAGPNHPMLGHIQSLSGTSSPVFNMAHLSALVALKVVNEGDGQSNNGDANIVVNELTFAIPDVSTVDADKKTVSQKQIPIVGAFVLTVSGEDNAVSFSPVDDATSNIVTLRLANSVTIAPGAEATFYIAVRPFGADSITRTNTDPILEVGINGSKRQVVINKDKAKFTSGNITTVRVPVKLSYPKVSDALQIMSSGRKEGDRGEQVIRLGESRNMTINGETVPVYVLSEDGNTQMVTIRGFAKDMFAALPLGFYASRWNNRPTAMKLHSVQLWLPKYSDGYKTITQRVEIRNYSDDWTLNNILLPGAAAVGVKFDNTYGIPRSTMDMFVKNQSLLNFNGIVDNYNFDENNVIILDENPVYKEVKPDRIDKFLESFTATVDNVKCTATCAGMEAILLKGVDDKTTGELVFPNDEDGAIENLASTTAKAIYYKLLNTLSDFKGVDLSGLMGNYFTGYEDFMRKIRDAKIQVVLETCPYDFSDSGTINPMVLWGFDAYGPNDETKPQQE